jgi:tartrate-resistant acid phosphatase type 5
MDAPVITLLVFLVAVAAATAAAEMPRMEHPRKGDGSLSLLAVGDWGRRGAYNQSMVAAQVID